MPIFLNLLNLNRAVQRVKFEILWISAMAMSESDSKIASLSLALSRRVQASSKACDSAAKTYISSEMFLGGDMNNRAVVVPYHTASKGDSIFESCISVYLEPTFGRRRPRKVG